jgi:hypothetical protein
MTNREKRIMREEKEWRRWMLRLLLPAAILFSLPALAADADIQARRFCDHCLNLSSSPSSNQGVNKYYSSQPGNYNDGSNSQLATAAAIGLTLGVVILLGLEWSQNSKNSGNSIITKF